MINYTVTHCVSCKAPILKGDATANHGAFHEDCYDKWMMQLEQELPIGLRTFATPLTVRVHAA